MSVIFNKKAIVLYGCAQVAEGVSVVNTAPTGTITTTVGSATVTGTGTLFTSEVAPHSYLYTTAGAIIGRVSSVNSNTSITLYAVVPASATSASTGVMAVATAVTDVAFQTGLGPDNALPVLEATFTTEYTTESFQYSGDELDRDEVTSVKDMFGSLSFPIMMPSLGIVSQTMTYGGSLRIDSATGETALYVSGDPTTLVAVGDYIYNYNKVLIGKVASVSTGPDSIVLVDNAAIAVTNARFWIGKALSTPAYDDLPAPDWFQAAGFGIVLSTGKAKYTNSVASDTLMTVEVRLSSAALASVRKQKTYTLTDVRGTMDADITIGSYGKLSFKYMGNTGLPTQKTTIVPVYGTKKADLAEIVSSTNITLSALASYVAKLQVTMSATTIASGETVIIGGLTFTAGSGGCTRANLVKVWSDLPLGVTAAEASALLLAKSVATTVGTFTSGTLTSFYTEKYNSTSVVFYSPAQEGNIATIDVDNGTGADPTFTLLSTSAEPPVPDSNNICFTKTNSPNLNGYTYTRFQRSCLDGWDKEAAPSDVTITILEDAADATYRPEANVGKPHTFNLFYGSDTNNRRVKLTKHKLILAKITPTTEGNSRGQDLNFRNVGTTDILFS